MNHMYKILVLMAAAAVAQGAPAQTSLPGLENFTLERPTPTPVPTATQTVAPRATPSATAASPRAAAPSPTPTATRRPALPEPGETTAPSPSASPAQVETPAPVATASATPTPAASEPPAPPSPQPATIAWLWWGALAGIVLAALAALLWWRRRRSEETFETEAVPVSEKRVPVRPARTTDQPFIPPAASEPSQEEPPVAPVPGGIVTVSANPGGLITSALKPELILSLEPVRGGVDTLRATLEFQLRLTNAGRGTARGVTVETWLTSASHETAEDLSALFSGSWGEPMLPPFDLPASAAIDLTGHLTLARDGLAVITAGERRSFVPVVAVRAGFADGRGLPTVTTAAFLVGIARAGQGRLAPLPLDRGARMHDDLAARPYE